MGGTGAVATHETVSDHELMHRHLDGDTTAFGELFRRHKDRMWALALRTTGDRELASDCVQDAFINAYRRAGSFRFDAAFTTKAEGLGLGLAIVKSIVAAHGGKITLEDGAKGALFRIQLPVAES